MFEFLTRRHAAPAETPLSEVRFTREDLFVLMGGSDTGMFAADDDTIDFGRLEREGMGAWRRDMAARLAPTGLVDAEGVPSDELAEALYPLNKPGVAVNDAPRPQRRGERDRRTVSAVFYDGAATAIRALPGRRAGFGLVPLPSNDNRDIWFQSVFRCPTLENAALACRYASKPNSRIGEALMRGDAEWMASYFADRGYDASQLRGFMRKVSQDGRMLGQARWFVASDYRGCVFEESLGFTIPQANSPSFAKKASLVFFSQGAAFTDAWARRLPEEEPTDFTVIEFLAEGSLLDFLLRPYSYPEELTAREEGTPCSSS